MRRLEFDEAEFSSGSEQSLVVRMALVREHTDLTAFLTACGIQRDLGVPATDTRPRTMFPDSIQCRFVLVPFRAEREPQRGRVAGRRTYGRGRDTAPRRSAP